MTTPDSFMRSDKFAGMGLTFDDVLLEPAESDDLPRARGVIVQRKDDPAPRQWWIWAQTRQLRAP